MATRTWAVLVALIAAGCGGDSGETGSGGGKAAEPTFSNDVGRSVEGCFECTDGEFCLIQTDVDSAKPDVNSCIESDCADDCARMIADVGKRLEICQTSYSCQADSGLISCFRDGD